MNQKRYERNESGVLAFVTDQADWVSVHQIRAAVWKGGADYTGDRNLIGIVRRLVQWSVFESKGGWDTTFMVRVKPAGVKP